MFLAKYNFWHHFQRYIFFNQELLSYNLFYVPGICFFPTRKLKLTVYFCLQGAITIKTALTNKLVYESLIRIFQKHGAVPVLSPLLMPKTSMYDNNAENYPCFMDHNGLLIGLPFDLRVSLIEKRIYNLIDVLCLYLVFDRSYFPL